MDDEKGNLEETDKRYSSKNSDFALYNTKKMVETREMIDAIQRRKCLWDRTDPEYRDRIAKDRAWKEIYRELEPNYDSLKPAMRHELGIHITKKWYNVRDSYVKSRKNCRTNRPYLYTEALSFLDNIYFGEGSESRVRNESSYIEDKIANDMSNDDEAEAETSENWINEVFIDVDENMREGSSKRPRLEYTQKVKEEIDDSEHSQVVNVLANLIQREEDDDRAFFKSITPSVKSLSQEAKLEFRIQVMKLIKVLRNKDKKGSFLKKEKVFKDSDSD